MNANLDVLELVFAHAHAADLVAAALVSRAFLAAVIPALYARVEYTAKHAKHAADVISPFATLAAHRHLLVHVKRIAVHAAPVFQPSSHQVSPHFLHHLAHALRAATNLRSFACTVKILPPLLPHLNDKPQLHHLRICAPLATRQMSVLQDRTGLQSLSLDFPSWCVVDALPTWSAAMHKTLAHLTIFMSQDIDPSVLNTTLEQLPRLRGLHVIGCPRITHTVVLKALSHTPELRELSFTIFPSQENSLPTNHSSIPPLTHLSIDIRTSYPGLKSLISRLITRLAPRDALAICGAWIGEIRGSSERTDGGAGNGVTGAGGGGGGPFGPNFHIWHGHLHLHGPMPGHGLGNDHANDPPLLTHPNPHLMQTGNPNPTQNTGVTPAAAGDPAPVPNFFGFPFAFPFGNPNGNDNGNDNDNDNDDDDDDPPPANPPNPDPSSPALVSSFPSTLTTLHLPQLSPTALQEIVERCDGIQVLGIVMGSAFASPTSVAASGRRGRLGGFGAKKGLRPEVSVLAGILSRARVLRELIIDTGGSDSSGSTSGAGAGADPGSGGSKGARFRGGTLLTPLAVRMLMRESPVLRRIVGEGRVWESPTPTPTSPLPFPHGLTMDLRLSKSRPGPGAGNNHAHGPPGFGMHGGGYGQVEVGNDHWFWLTESASGGKLYGGF